MRIVFPYLAQMHQVLHSLPIAAAMAERHPGVDVHVAACSGPMLDFAKRLLERHAPRARVAFDRLPLGYGDEGRLAMGLGRSHLKKYALLRNRRYFDGFDAVVTPERTSLFLRTIGVRARLVWTRHGAGDREIGFAPDVRGFDFVLMAGSKIEQRLLRAGLIRSGHYATGVYAKFDWAQGRCAPLFDNGRPTVLYNPHFRPGLSSWPRLGRGVLDALAGSSRFNLVFAPHVRLYDPPTAADRQAFSGYARLPHFHVDLGSERSIDMSYTQCADLYLGDVSSQVAEFVRRPRPCLFLDAHGTPWRGNPSYQSWTLGQVLGSTDALESRLDEALATHAAYVPAQQAYLEETFELRGGPSAPRGADAIVEHLALRSERFADNGRAALRDRIAPRAIGLRRAD